ncbi:hypothetical protein STSP_60900 [Streptomyces jeddahensis]|uniref:DUF742 domain-containing protein n=2 Tax=Streptomyces jeddahensis TaxID=1716141 RepID=A0A177HI02_9ACTN|nr:hypothetical protein STSP_60900 [Streptomyces jeddahensis]
MSGPSDSGTVSAGPSGGGTVSDASGGGMVSDSSDEDTTFVRPFIITGGRVEPAQADLRLETLVVAVEVSDEAAPPGFERVGVPPDDVRARIVALCAQPTTVAQVAQGVGVPLGVAKVLIADLVVAGLLTCQQPSELPLHTLERIRDHVRAL